MAKVTALHIYPIKSLGGVDLESSVVGPRGLQDDRRWMLVDEEGKFLSQRTLEGMATFRTTPVEGGYRVEGPKGGEFLVPAESSGPLVTVQVWQSTVEAIDVSPEADAWFTDQMDRPCRLVWMPEESKRPVDPNFSVDGDHVGFADAYPILVISEASLAHLNSRLESPIPMNRFRGNIIVDGIGAHEEDTWESFTLNGLRFRRAKQCGRCRVTTTCQETGEVGTEPIHTLTTYRLEANRILFGTYFIPDSDGDINVGDEVVVNEVHEG